MGATKLGELVEPADVLAGHDDQAIELRPADHDDVPVDVLGHVGGITHQIVVHQPLRNGTGEAPRFRGHVPVGRSRQPMVLIHVMPPP